MLLEICLIVMKQNLCHCLRLSGMIRISGLPPELTKKVTTQEPDSSSPTAARVFFTAGFAVAGCKARSRNLLRTAEGGEGLRFLILREGMGCAEM